MPRITGLKRLDDTIKQVRCIGDNWLMTWAKSGKLYTNLCDGTAEGSTGWNTRTFILNGNPEDGISFEFLSGFPDITYGNPPNENRYYAFGIIAIDDRIYNFLNTPKNCFLPNGSKFCGTKLVYSPNLGKTWFNQDGSKMYYEQWDERTKRTMLFFNEPNNAFALVSVLQMGQNYEYNRDGYVYLYSPNGDREGTMNQLAIARVKKEQVLNRPSYEFFVKCNPDGTAVWDKDIAKRGPSHTFPEGWVNKMYHPYAWQPCVVYYPKTAQYLMSNFGMATNPKDGMWFDAPSYLGFWTSKNPWGPWEQVHEDKSWTPGGDKNARCYQPQIVPKWIAHDGLSFWLVWTDFQEIAGKGRPNYCFNYQKVDVILEP